MHSAQCAPALTALMYIARGAQAAAALVSYTMFAEHGLLLRAPLSAAVTLTAALHQADSPCSLLWFSSCGFPPRCIVLVLSCSVMPAAGATALGL